MAVVPLEFAAKQLKTLGDVFLVATFLVVVRGPVEVFLLGDAFLVAALVAV